MVKNKFCSIVVLSIIIMFFLSLFLVYTSDEDDAAISISHTWNFNSESISDNGDSAHENYDYYSDRNLESVLENEKKLINNERTEESEIENVTNEHEDELLENQEIEMSGTIVDRYKKPISNAEITILNINKTNTLVRAKSNQEGKFSFLLNAESFYITTTHSEYANDIRFVENISQNNDITIMLLPKCLITGRTITQDGIAIANATINAISSNKRKNGEKYDELKVISDNKGEFIIKDIGPKLYLLKAQKDNYIGQTFANMDAGAVRQIDIICRVSSSLEIIVHGLSDDTKAEVSVVNATERYSSIMSNSQKMVLENLISDNYWTIRSSAPGYAITEKHVKLAAGEHKTVEVFMSEIKEIRGIVYDECGKPVENVKVTLLLKLADNLKNELTTQTDSSGEFTFNPKYNLTNNNCSLHTDISGYKRCYYKGDIESEFIVITITKLNSSKWTFRSYSTSEKPVGTLFLHYKKGHQKSETDNKTVQIIDGEVLLPDLKEGIWICNVKSENGYWTEEVIVPKDIQTNRIIHLKKCPVLNLKITDSTEIHPIENADILIYSTQISQISWSGKTDSEGLITFSNLIPGEYRLVITSPLEVHNKVSKTLILKEGQLYSLTIPLNKN